MGGDQKPVRGYIDGCFDIMHSGHYNAVRQAKAICDVLIVGVHSDPEIEDNKSVPVMRQAERYGLLEHIKWIDEIVHDVPYSPEIATLELARADFCIHGDDMPVNAQGVCAYDEMKQAGRLRLIKRTEGVSTTDLIGRLLTLSRHQHTTEHPWQRPASPDLAGQGVRVRADDAFEHCALAAASGPDALAPVMDMVRELAVRYNISTGDVELFKDTIATCLSEQASGACRDAPASAANLGTHLASAPKECNADEVRTAAPVQLLASTRRIAEFASGRQPSMDDRVVYACGSFDMFHVGHAQFLKEAKARGTFLLIGIHEDLTVSRTKGAHFPVMNLNERVLNVCACKWVDEVIIGAPAEVTEDIMKTWNIHLVVRGAGHQRNGGQSDGEARYTVPARMGAYAEVPSRWPDLCHETVVRRVIRSREIYQSRNRDRARREDVYYASKDQSNSPPEA